MDKISVISYNQSQSKIITQYLSGQEVTYIYSPKSRRRLRKYLNGYGAQRAVVCGDAPLFVNDVLRKADIPVCNGRAFMRAIYPRLISRGAKMSGDCTRCTIYGDDDDLLDIIVCAAGYFKNVSLCSSSADERIAEKVMDLTGLALNFGETDGVGIICDGRGGKQKIKVDLTERSKTVFCDSEHNIISPSLAEALAGDNLAGDLLERLQLKIHSLC